MLQCPLFSFVLQCEPSATGDARGGHAAPTHPHGSSAVRFHGRRPAASLSRLLLVTVLPGRSWRRRGTASPSGRRHVPPHPLPGHREDRPWEGEGLPLRGVRQDHHAGGGRGSRTPVPLLWEGARTFAQYWAEPQLFPVRAPAGASVGRCGTVSSTDPRSCRYRGQHRTF